MKPRLTTPARSVSSAVVSTCSEWRASSLASRSWDGPHEARRRELKSTIRPAPAAPTSVLNRQQAPGAACPGRWRSRVDNRGRPRLPLVYHAPHGPFLQTMSGRRVEPVRPPIPSQLNADDIARALAEASVASAAAAASSTRSPSAPGSGPKLVEQRGRRSYQQLAHFIIHNKSEAYLGDMPHPIKHRSKLGAALKAVRGAPRAGAPGALAEYSRHARDQARRPRPARYRAPGVQRRELALAGLDGVQHSNLEDPSPGRPRRPPSRSDAATPNPRRAARLSDVLPPPRPPASPPSGDRARIPSRLARLYAEVMETEPGRVTVAFRELGENSIKRTNANRQDITGPGRAVRGSIRRGPPGESSASGPGTRLWARSRSCWTGRPRAPSSSSPSTRARNSDTGSGA